MWNLPEHLGVKPSGLLKASRMALCLTLLAFLVGGVVAPTVSAQVETPHVLLLHSYHQGLSWTDGVTRGIKDVFAASELTPELYVEYMDTKRFAPTEALYEQLYALYAEKYRDVPLDLILVSDNNAFNFILAYHETLFPEVPVVFCGVNFFEDAMLAGVESYFTGVVEDVDIRATLDVMLDLHPDTREIVVVNDATTTGQVYQRLLREITPQYEARVDFRYYENPDLAEMLPALQTLPEDTLILLVLLNRDRDGRFFTYEESMEIIYENASVPVYGLWDFYMGHGLVGGMLTNAHAQGEAAAGQALKILRGAAVAEVPVLKESPNRYIFDYRELKRWGIDLQKLPPDSQIRNRPPALYEQYRNVIWPAVAVILTLTAVVVVQLVNLRKRHEIEADLRASNRALEEVRAALEERVALRTADLEKRSGQLATAAAVARDVTGFRDFDALLTTTVQRITQRFGYYHAGIFLIDESGEYAVLRAASSEGGQRMLQRGHRLQRGKGLVGTVLDTGQSRVALDVGEDVRWFDNPDLPETRSEIVLPLRVRGELLGVFDVQSKEERAFDEEDVAVLETLADQLALAIDNVRLYEESQRALQEMERVYGEHRREVWRQRIATRPMAFQYTGVDVKPVSVEAAGDAPEGEDGRSLRAEITWGEQLLAVLELTRDRATWATEERRLVEAVATQASLALENARLLEETRARAAREQQVGEITANIRAQLDIEAILEEAVRELGKALDADRAVAHLALGDGGDERRGEGRETAEIGGDG